MPKILVAQALSPANEHLTAFFAYPIFMTAAAQTTGRPELRIQLPDGTTRTVALERDRYGLGRTLANDLCYPEVSGLSREHLVFERTGTNWTLRDLGSTNGTLINGKPLTAPHVLEANDRVTAGQLTVVFTETARPAAAQTVIFIEKPPTPPGGTTLTATLDGLLSDEKEIQGIGHMQAFIRAGRELVGHMPLETLFELILDLSVEAVKASRGVLMTLEDGGELRVRASKGAGFRISSRVRDLVLNERRSLLVRDALRHEALAASESIVAQQIRSVLAVPLQAENRVSGLIYLDSPGFIQEFTTEDLNLLTVMGNMAAIRIEHARLIEVEQAEKLRAQELAHAAQIQQSILPHKFPAFPDRKDFELHAAMVPAKEVGGDFFDFFLLDPEHLGFVIGDVSGKGVPAALFMAVSRTLLRAFAQHRATPGECLAYMNSNLAVQSDSAMFTTVFYGILDTRTGELQFANGGHNRPYVLAVDGQPRPLSLESGPIVGIMDGFAYDTYTGQLAPGESLILYTDGVTEARDKNDTFFGEKRLEELLSAHCGESAEQLVASLHAAVQEFAIGEPQADDITVLALRFLSAEPQP
jgi:sigma-B regulation protein RsbU (phosphoserine phosphatase)